METGESNIIYSFDDKSFKYDLAKNHHLAIEISEKSITYCLLNNLTNTYCLLQSYKIESIDEISNIINNSKHLLLSFSSTSIGLINLPNTLVPKEFYNKKNAKSIFNINSQADEVIKDDYLNSDDTINIYTLSNQLNETIKNYFPNAKIKSHSTILLESLLRDNTKTENFSIFLKDNIANMIFINNSKIIFQNKFEYSTNEDLLYYTLFSFQQLGISAEKISLNLFGDLEDNQFKLLYDYIRDINLGNRPKDFIFPKEASIIKNHYFFGLFNQVLCA